MMLSSNLWGLILSYVGVFAVLVAAQQLMKKHISAAAARKLVHIGVSHWWLIAILFFDSMIFALIGPLSFIVINALSYRYHIFRAMEHPEKRRNLGTVYFPISLAILTAAVFGGVMPVEAATIGILCMGWGDGMGALVGEHLPAHRHQVTPHLLRRIRDRKTLGGTLGVQAASTAVAIIVLVVSAPAAWPALLSAAIIIGVLTALIELFSPLGLDNITIPIGIALAAWLLLDILAPGSAAAGPLQPVSIARMLLLPTAVNIVVASIAYLRRGVTFSGVLPVQPSEPPLPDLADGQPGWC